MKDFWTPITMVFAVLNLFSAASDQNMSEVCAWVVVLLFGVHILMLSYQLGITKEQQRKNSP